MTVMKTLKLCLWTGMFLLLVGLPFARAWDPSSEESAIPAQLEEEEGDLVFGTVTAVEPSKISLRFFDPEKGRLVVKEFLWNEQTRFEDGNSPEGLKPGAQIEIETAAERPAGRAVARSITGPKSAEAKREALSRQPREFKTVKEAGDELAGEALDFVANRLEHET